MPVSSNPVSLANGEITLHSGDILAVTSGGGVVTFTAIRLDSEGLQLTLTITTDAKATARCGVVALPTRPGGRGGHQWSTMRETFIMLARDDGRHRLRCLI